MASSSPYYPRRPRHPVVERNTLSVGLQLAGTEVRPAGLVDISRHGFCVQLPAPLPREESVVLLLRDDTSGLNLQLPGVVRWLHEEDDGAWSVGCAAVELLSWETLGELFLNGILSTDAGSQDE